MEMENKRKIEEESEVCQKRVCEGLIDHGDLEELPKRKLRKFVLLLSYCGKGYLGMQRLVYINILLCSKKNISIPFWFMYKEIFFIYINFELVINNPFFLLVLNMIFLVDYVFWFSIFCNF